MLAPRVNSVMASSNGTLHSAVTVISRTANTIITPRASRMNPNSTQCAGTAGPVSTSHGNLAVESSGAKLDTIEMALTIALPESIRADSHANTKAGNGTFPVT